MISPKYLDLIAPYNLWGVDIDTGIFRREYVDRIIKVFSIPNVVVSVSGIRRCGKTYICRQVLKWLIDQGMERVQTLYIDFENPSLQPLLSVEFLDDIYETYRHYLNPISKVVIVLDEVSNIIGWEKWVRKMQDIERDVNIIVTGSSSKLMADDMAQVLTGRFIDIRVYPLDLVEYSRFEEMGSYVDGMERIFPKSMLEGFLLFGGFPTTALTADPLLRSDYLKELYNSILARDVVIKNKVRKVEHLKKCSALMMTSVSSHVSVRRITHAMKSMGIKVSSATINDYFYYLRQALLFYYVPIFSYKVKDQMQYPKKLYIVDTGMLNAVSFKMSENLAVFAENAIAIELIRRFGQESVFYWKGGRGKEVDFAVVRDGVIMDLIQVCWDVNDPKTLKRETDSMKAAMDEMGFEKGTILIHDDKRDIKVDAAIEVRGIKEWLLDKGADPKISNPS